MDDKEITQYYEYKADTIGEYIIGEDIIIRQWIDLPEIGKRVRITTIVHEDFPFDPDAWADDGFDNWWEEYGENCESKYIPDRILDLDAVYEYWGKHPEFEGKYDIDECFFENKRKDPFCFLLDGEDSECSMDYCPKYN